MQVKGISNPPLLEASDLLGRGVDTPSPVARRAIGPAEVEDETPWIEADLNLIGATRLRFAVTAGRYGWEAA